MTLFAIYNADIENLVTASNDNEGKFVGELGRRSKEGAVPSTPCVVLLPLYPQTYWDGIIKRSIL